MTTIELHDVALSDAAVARTSVTASTGQVLGVVGASDVDTHEFVRVLAGVLPPTSGTIDGIPDPQEQAWIPRGNQLAMTLTALENVTVPLITGGADPAEALETARSVLRDVGLEEREDRLIEELSGGQQQRVSVARALAQPAAVIIAEDPTSALDASTRRRVLALLRSAAEDRLVVISTSAAENLEDVADVVVDLDDV